MALVTYLAVAIFLPAFPLSMVFNALYARAGFVVLRALFLLVWPQIGVFLLSASIVTPPRGLMFVAVFTSLFYGLRALALRDVNRWVGFLATSAWALLWIPAAQGVDAWMLHIYAFGFSAPLVLLTVLAWELERRFGAAYTGLYGGLAQALPRFSGVLVFVVLAIIATPVFPGFAAMLKFIVAALPVTPFSAAGVVGVWLLWSWSGARLLQGLIIGPVTTEFTPDLGRSTTWLYAGVLCGLAVAGIYGMGNLR